MQNIHRLVLAASFAALAPFVKSTFARASEAPRLASVAPPYAPFAVGDDAHDPESEPDFGPGFFSESLRLPSEESLPPERLRLFELGPQNQSWNPAWILQQLLDSGDRAASQVAAAAMAIPQTVWNECRDRTTGQYLTYSCVQRRGISVALDDLLQDRLVACVSEGLGAMGDGCASSVHLVHVGVAGNAEHSPKSLHSVNRAIDISAIHARIANGATRQVTYSKAGNRPFYEALRRCWGRTVISTAQCPAYDGRPDVTGSIGWEDPNHGRHMHLSVPDCANGAYGSRYWRR